MIKDLFSLFYIDMEYYLDKKGPLMRSVACQFCGIKYGRLTLFMHSIFNVASMLLLFAKYAVLKRVNRAVLHPSLRKLMFLW